MGGSSLLGSLPGPKNQAVFSRRLFSAVKLGFCWSQSVLSLTPQQHSAAPWPGHPSDPSPCLERPPGPQPTLLSLKVPPRHHSLPGGPLWLHSPRLLPQVGHDLPQGPLLPLPELMCRFGSFMYVSVITTCYRFRVPPCHWPWAGSE